MTSPALELRGVGKDYGSRTAVGAIDLKVNRGECVGLLGPNGAGKTTTISMACGILTPTRGTIAIGGVELARRPLVAKAKLGLVPQELALYDELPALDNLRYFGGLYGLTGSKLAERVAWTLALVGLRERAREPVRRFSGGMKRRLNLAAGLLHSPEVLILDEPTVGVDPQSRHRIFDTVRQLRAEGMSIVYSTHYLDEVERLCDRVAIVDRGAIIATGSVAELIARHAVDGASIALAGPSAAIEAAAAAVAATSELVRNGDTLRLRRSASLAPVITAIESAGATVARIDARGGSLEAAFLALTGRALRDEP
jgi:ABC-2 type transport system ATP-binding protein